MDLLVPEVISLILKLTLNSPICTVAAVSIDLDKANLSTESHKTLGFTIFDLKLRD